MRWSTDGRFSGGASGLSIGHVSPEAAEGGLIGLVETGDTIAFDIPNRRISLEVEDGVIADRRAAMLARGAAAWLGSRPSASARSRRRSRPMRRSL